MTQRTTPDAVKLWINTTFRDGLHDPEIINFAIAILKVGNDMRQPPNEIVRNMAASIVLQIAGMHPAEWK